MFNFIHDNLNQEENITDNRSYYSKILIFFKEYANHCKNDVLFKLFCKHMNDFVGECKSMLQKETTNSYHTYV